MHAKPLIIVTAVLAAAGIAASCGMEHKRYSQRSSFSHPAGAGAGDKASGDNASAPSANFAAGPTMGRLMWDQVGNLTTEIYAKAGADKPTILTSRAEVVAFGGVPFPFSESTPKYRPNLMSSLLVGRFLKTKTCAKVLDALNATTPSAQSVKAMFLYLLGETPSDEEVNRLMEIAQITTAKGTSGMELVCVALIGDDRFTTL